MLTADMQSTKVCRQRGDAQSTLHRVRQWQARVDKACAECPLSAGQRHCLQVTGDMAMHH